MISITGYIALSINLVSMAIKDVLRLRIGSLTANCFYIFYGVMIQAMPIVKYPPCHSIRK